MKRVLLFVLCLTMVLSLCACGEDSTSQEGVKETETAAPQEDVQETKMVTAAVASMYVMNMSKEMDGSYSGISAAGIEASRKLVDECIVLIRSNRVINAIVEAYQADGGTHVPDAAALRKALRMESVEETALMRITVLPFAEGVTDEELLLMCKAVLDVAPRIVEAVMNDLVSLKPVDKPILQQIEIEK